MLVYHHALGDIHLTTESSVRLSALERPPFARFAVDAAPAALMCRFVGVAEPGDIAANPEVDARLDAVCARPDDHAVDRRPESVVVIDRAARQTEAFFRDSMAPMVTSAYIGPFLTAALLPELGATLLHGACVDRNGRGYLLVAPDGGGKTTAARQSDGGRVLGDDQILVRQANGRLIASATPWGMMIDGPCSVGLDALVLLEKAPGFTLDPVRPEVVLSTLWDEQQLVLPLTPRATRRRLFTLVAGIASRVPGFRMGFSPGGIRWEELDSRLSG